MVYGTYRESFVVSRRGRYALEAEMVALMREAKATSFEDIQRKWV